MVIYAAWREMASSSLWPRSRQVKWTVMDNACLSSLTDIKPFKMGVTNNKHCIPEGLLRNSVNYKDLVQIWLLNICRGSPCQFFFQGMHKTSINGLYRLFVAFKLPYFVKRTYNAPVKVVFCQFEKFGFLQILVQNSCSKPILVIKSLYLGVGGMSNFFWDVSRFCSGLFYMKWYVV